MIMPLRCCCLLLLVPLTSAWCQDVAQLQAASDPVADAASESVELFDGQTLNGWVVLGGSARYRVEDGSIVGTTADGSPNTFLCTTRDYANFDLTFEVLCDEDLNSGVQIRSHVYLEDTPQESRPGRLRRAGEVYGYQCEITSRGGQAGNFWDEGRRTRWLDDFAGRPEAREAFRSGEWNRFRIVARGRRIRSWVNGVPCADFQDDRDPSGFIGLQVHGIRSGSGPYEVRWRNLELRELSINPGINSSFQAPDVGQFTDRFERESREVYDKRQQIIDALQIEPGMAVADIGAGTGLFTRLLAQATGASGRVYAVDVAEEFVKHVELSCRQAGWNNVRGIVCTQSTTGLEPDSVDVALICDTYHHFEFPYLTIGSLHRALRPGGRLVLIDFVKQPGVSSDFVLSHVRAPQAEFSREIEQCGFRRVAGADFLSENYLVIFERSALPPGHLSGVGRATRRLPDIPYRPGNEAWHLDAWMPPARFPRPRPAIVFVHGGGWRGGDKSRGRWQTDPEHFSRLGYVTLSVNYRLTDQAPFPACLEDVKCSVRWLRDHARHLGVDPGRVGALGISAGAHLVTMLGLVGQEAGLEGDGPFQDQSSQVRAVCAAATPTDFLHWPAPISTHRAVGPLLAGPSDSLQERARRASPVSYATSAAPPLFLIHGGQDTIVPIDQAERLVAALRQTGASRVQYLSYGDTGHNVFGQYAADIVPMVERFFARTLAAGDP
jgi:acetyl esterase/lipase